MDIRKTVVTLNTLGSIPVPGITRDGVFIGESPVSTFIQYRAVNLRATEPRSVLIEHPCTVDTIIVSDPANSTKYDFIVETTEGFRWIVSVPATLVYNYGVTRIISFPSFVLDKGYKLTITPTNTLPGLVVFTKLAINVDIRDF